MNDLKQTAKVILYNIEEFQKKVNQANATNEQFFLDFQDELNKLSVLY